MRKIHKALFSIFILFSIFLLVLSFKDSKVFANNELSNKESIKVNYQIEGYIVNIKIENIKDSMLAIKVYDEFGKIEYLTQIEKECIFNGQANLLFSVKKQGKYNIEIQGDISTRVKIENINVDEIISIKNIDDINISITKGETFKLPKEVTAKMSNGEDKKVEVKWSCIDVDTSKIGKQVFEGNVKGYNKKVKFNLEVKEPEVIKFVEDISIELDQNEEYILPNKVKAMMSSGTYKEIEVNWDKKFIDTSKIGEFVIEGQVSGFKNKVKLKVNVEALNNDDIINFSNPELKDLIKDLVGKNKEPIYRKDLDKVTSLSLSGNEVFLYLTDINDLKVFRNLKELDLSNNVISDLTPLSKLKKLEKLSLYANINPDNGIPALENIDSLKNLTNLRTLNLASNGKIKDIAALSNLTNLIELRLNGNNIEDISPLINHESLKKLTLSGNNIKDFSSTGKYFENLIEKDFKLNLYEVKDNSLEVSIEKGVEFLLPHVVKLTDVNKNMSVNWNEVKIDTNIVGQYDVEGKLENGQSIKLILKIKDLNSSKKVEFKDKNLETAVRLSIDKPSGEIYISDVINLKKLDGGSRDIKDLTGIETLVSLEELMLWNNRISDISPLKNLKKLKRLDLMGNKLTIINSSIFDNLNNLEELFLNNNNITTIKNSAFKGLKNLNHLDIAENEIENISELSVLSNLKELYINNNHIRDINGVKNLKKLTLLWAGSNYIKDINSLKDLENVNWIKLDNNKILEISSLKNCKGIQRLCLSNNSISSLNGIEEMSNLEWLEADNNRINNINAVNKLINLTILILNNNEIKDVQPIANLKHLNQLTLKNNPVKDFSVLKDIYNNIKRKDFNIN